MSPLKNNIIYYQCHNWIALQYSFTLISAFFQQILRAIMHSILSDDQDHLIF